MWRLLALLCAVNFIRFWILPARDGLWIDETGSHWTIAGGWDEIFFRTSFHPNSRLYAIFLLGWSKVAGVSEIALRIPSLIAAVTAVCVLTVFMWRRFGWSAAFAVCAIAVASPEISFYALDVRSYPFALLAVCASTMAWFELHCEWRWKWAAIWVLSAATLVHLHPVVSAALAAQLIWMLWRMDWKALTLRRALALCGLFAAVAILAIPEVIRLMPIILGMNVSAIPGKPAMVEVTRRALPISIFAPAAIAAGVLLLTRRWKVRKLDAGAMQLAMLGLSLFVVALTACGIFTYSRNNNLMIARYLIAIYPGLFLLAGVLLARWTSDQGRVLFGICFASSTLALSVYAQGWVPIHADADWRGAMAVVREWEQDRPAPLLFQTGFVEGVFTNVMSAPKWQKFLYAPAVYYPHAGPTYALPYLFGAWLQPYWDGLMPRVHGQRFAALVYSSPGRTPYYIRKLEEAHGPARRLAEVRRLSVYAFGPP